MTPEQRDPRTLERVDFPEIQRVSTRWSDNDMYGHLNNAVYYELFDAAINTWTGHHGGAAFSEAPVIGVSHVVLHRAPLEAAFGAQALASLRAHPDLEFVVEQDGVIIYRIR